MEKLKALKDLEAKKDGEMQALKEELKQLKGGDIVPASSSSAPIAGSLEEVTAKLEAYQSFMSNYIVNTQQEKYNAVKAAEAAIAKKYEGKLNAFMLSPAAADEEKESKLYKDRNAKIAAAAKAGKSRWGDKEVQKVGGTTTSGPKATIKAEVPSSTPVSSETIDAADHGLRADGGVGGLTLEERVTTGAASVTNGAAVPATQSSIFAMRNANIANAAKAGRQSRWGVKEEQKAVEGATNALPAAPASIEVSPEINAADHGLRADGGVSGPSLAERVNLGAKLLQ